MIRSFSTDLRNSYFSRTVVISNIDPGQKIQVIRDRIIKYHSLIEEKTENIKYLLFFSGEEDINSRFRIIHDLCSSWFSFYKRIGYKESFEQASRLREMPDDDDVYERGILEKALGLIQPWLNSSLVNSGPNVNKMIDELLDILKSKTIVEIK